MIHRFTLAAALGLLVASTAAGATDRFETVVQRMIGEYLKVHSALAADSVREVGPAARALVKLAGELRVAPPRGQHADQYRELPAKIQLAAQHLGAAHGLPAAREAMKELSRPLALWASLAQPPDVNVIYCPMAKASWLQRDAVIRNPYYGAQMLRCGEIVSGPAKGGVGGHLKKH